MLRVPTALSYATTLLSSDSTPIIYMLHVREWSDEEGESVDGISNGTKGLRRNDANVDHLTGKVLKLKSRPTILSNSLCTGEPLLTLKLVQSTSANCIRIISTIFFPTVYRIVLHIWIALFIGKRARRCNPLSCLILVTALIKTITAQIVKIYLYNYNLV